MDELEIVNLSDIDSYAERDIDYQPLAKKIKQEDLVHYERQKQKNKRKKLLIKQRFNQREIGQGLIDLVVVPVLIIMINSSQV